LIFGLISYIVSDMAKKTAPRNELVAHYLSLPYMKILQKSEDDGCIIAWIKELPGCTTHGECEPTALKCLHEAQRIWIESAIENGDDIPEPEKETGLPSGKWIQRVPRSLHMKLARLAEVEHVSLNQFVTSILAGGVEYRKPNKKPAPHGGRKRAKV
jgi:antitoxin HicB